MNKKYFVLNPDPLSWNYDVPVPQKSGKAAFEDMRVCRSLRFEDVDLRPEN